MLLQRNHQAAIILYHLGSDSLLTSIDAKSLVVRVASHPGWHVNCGKTGETRSLCTQLLCSMWRLPPNSLVHSPLAILTVLGQAPERDQDSPSVRKPEGSRKQFDSVGWRWNASFSMVCYILYLTRAKEKVQTQSILWTKFLCYIDICTSSLGAVPIRAMCASCASEQMFATTWRHPCDVVIAWVSCKSILLKLKKTA